MLKRPASKKKTSPKRKAPKLVDNTLIDDREDLTFIAAYEAHPERFKNITKEEEKHFVAAAACTLDAIEGAKLDDEGARRITIRIAEPLLSQLKQMAAKEGLPYQTMIQSLQHKSVTGQTIPRSIFEEREALLRRERDEALERAFKAEQKLAKSA